MRFDSEFGEYAAELLSLWEKRFDAGSDLPASEIWKACPPALLEHWQDQIRKRRAFKLIASAFDQETQHPRTVKSDVLNALRAWQLGYEAGDVPSEATLLELLSDEASLSILDRWIARLHQLHDSAARVDIDELLDRWEEQFTESNDLSAQDLCGKDVPQHIVVEVAHRIARRRAMKPFQSSSQNTESETADLELTPGAFVAGTDFVLLKCIGQGGFGQVWKARNDTTKELVALKFYTRLDTPLTLTNEAKHSIRMKKHIGDLAALDGFVQLVGTSINRPDPFVAYEFVDGEDFDKYLETRFTTSDETPLSVLEAATVIHKFASIMAAAHSLSDPLVHRDLKPANILVLRTGPDWKFKIADLGMAVLDITPGKPTDSSLTDVGQHFSGGTWGYLPPDASNHPSDDVYALAVIWYQLLTADLKAFAPTGGDWKTELEKHGMTQEQIAFLESCFGRKQSRPKDCGALAERIQQMFLSLPFEIHKDFVQITSLMQSGDDWKALIDTLRKTRQKQWNAGSEQHIPEAEWIHGLQSEQAIGNDIKLDHGTARRFFERAAKAGLADAQYSLALYYAFGFGDVAQDSDKAKEWISKAADQGHAAAQYELGLIYLETATNEKDITRAGSCFHSAAEQNHVEAQFQLAKRNAAAPLARPITDFTLSDRTMRYLESGNITTLGDLTETTEQALRIKKFSDKQITEIRSLMEEYGLRIGQNLEKNIGPTSKFNGPAPLLSLTGTAHGTFNEGVSGTPGFEARSPFRVFTWPASYLGNVVDDELLRQAAANGHPEAQFTLGWILEFGLLAGRKKDYREAAAWYRKAAIHGHLQAQWRLVQCCVTLLDQMRESSDNDTNNYTGAKKLLTTEARIWCRRTALRHHPPAVLLWWESNSAGCEHGPGNSILNESDPCYDRESIWLLYKAATDGDAACQYALAQYMSAGTWDAIEFNQAIAMHGTSAAHSDHALKWMHKAANNGIRKAQVTLGYIYSHGELITQEYDDGKDDDHSERRNRAKANNIIRFRDADLNSRSGIDAINEIKMRSLRVAAVAFKNDGDYSDTYNKYKEEIKNDAAPTLESKFRAIKGMFKNTSMSSSDSTTPNHEISDGAKMMGMIDAFYDALIDRKVLAWRGVQFPDLTPVLKRFIPTLIGKEKESLNHDDWHPGETGTNLLYNINEFNNTIKLVVLRQLKVTHLFWQVNWQEAEKWLTLAARQGHTDSVAVLIMYRRHLGMPAWLRKQNDITRVYSYPEDEPNLQVKSAEHCIESLSWGVDAKLEDQDIEEALLGLVTSVDEYLVHKYCALAVSDASKKEKSNRIGMTLLNARHHYHNAAMGAHLGAIELLYGSDLAAAVKAAKHKIDCVFSII